jgi:hypothetical protein
MAKNEKFNVIFFWNEPDTNEERKLSSIFTRTTTPYPIFSTSNQPSPREANGAKATEMKQANQERRRPSEREKIWNYEFSSFFFRTSAPLLDGFDTHRAAFRRDSRASRTKSTFVSSIL